MEINQFTTQSGFNPGMEAALFIRDYNKSLELGAYFDGKSLKLTGLSLTHKHYLLKKYFDNKKIFEPYVFYNFIYRSTILDTILTTKTILAKTICPDKATYTSLEHYAGIGIEVNVKNIMYFNGNIGVGGYIGSIKKPCLDQNSIIYRGSSGLGVIVRFGFGFRIP
jgi:hypothetical protein